MKRSFGHLKASLHPLARRFLGILLLTLYAQAMMASQGRIRFEFQKILPQAQADGQPQLATLGCLQPETARPADWRSVAHLSLRVAAALVERCYGNQSCSAEIGQRHSPGGSLAGLGPASLRLLAENLCGPNRLPKDSPASVVGQSGVGHPGRESQNGVAQPDQALTSPRKKRHAGPAPPGPYGDLPPRN